MENILKLNESKNFTKETLLYVEVDANQVCELSLASFDHNQYKELSLPAGWVGIIMLKFSTMKILNGQLKIQTICSSVMGRMQVFFDRWNLDRDKLTEKSQKVNWVALEVPSNLDLKDEKTKETWWLNSLLHLSHLDEIKILSVLLRKSETYNLVQYLYDEFHAGSCVKELSKKYGVSVSHFRRLATVALGGSTKGTFHDWRISNAVLDLVTGDDNNFTDIAMKHGYASLSHFSTDVKATLGMPPRLLTKNILSN